MVFEVDKYALFVGSGTQELTPFCRVGFNYLFRPYSEVAHTGSFQSHIDDESEFILSLIALTQSHFVVL